MVEWTRECSRLPSWQPESTIRAWAMLLTEIPGGTLYGSSSEESGRLTPPEH